MRLDRVTVVLFCTLLALPATAEERKLPEHLKVWLRGTPKIPSENWTIAYGGRLYDNWAQVLDVKLPNRTHPAYPATGQQKGEQTWRCKECHGWDYRGVSGHYASGSHYTGIKGLSGVAGADPARIVAVLRDQNHQYTPQMISDEAAFRLALFVAKGQYDIDKVIDPNTRRIKGDPNLGIDVFQNLCAICHGFDGKAKNLGSKKTPAYVGTVAQENPWELMHKIRNGHSGEPMPANLWMDMSILTAIGAYCQSLPAD